MLPQTITPVLAAMRARLLAVPSWVLLIEVFIGAGWLRAGTEKLISSDWWSGDALAGFLTDTGESRVPWFDLVVDALIGPNLILVSAAVVVVQFAVGAALVSGRARVPALLGGLVLNTTFVLAGAVTPSAFYVLAQLAVLLWVIETGRSRLGGALASGIGLTGLALAGSAVLSISTLHPAHVIDDPSMMLVFLGGLTVVGTERARLGSTTEPEIVDQPLQPIG